MNTLRFSTFSLILAVAVITLGYASYSSAAKKGIDCTDPSSHPSCKPSDDSSPSENLSASFCLTIDATTSSPYIVSDGKSQPPGDPFEYCDDSKEKVAVFTGSGTGFRFDTNLQNGARQAKFMMWRLVFMDISVPSTSFEIDFRFNLPTGGLDLGSLVAQDDTDGSCPSGSCTGTVDAWIRYYAGGVVSEFNDQNWGKLGFGAIHAYINDNPDDPHEAARVCLAPIATPESRKILVTRTSADTWTLESNEDGKACRFSLEGSGNVEEECAKVACSFVQSKDEIDFKFKFLLKIQPE